jgi:hypothetical protein
MELTFFASRDLRPHINYLPCLLDVEAKLDYAFRRFRKDLALLTLRLITDFAVADSPDPVSSSALRSYPKAGKYVQLCDHAVSLNGRTKTAVHLAWSVTGQYVRGSMENTTAHKQHRQ